MHRARWPGGSETGKAMWLGQRSLKLHVPKEANMAASILEVSCHVSHSLDAARKSPGGCLVMAFITYRKKLGKPRRHSLRTLLMTQSAWSPIEKY